MGEIIHVVVEELLKLLVDKVDGDLLEAVVLEDLKASNVKHSTEVGLLHCGIHLANKALAIKMFAKTKLNSHQSGVTLLNQPLEDTVKDGPGNATNSVGGLLTSLRSRVVEYIVMIV